MNKKLTTILLAALAAALIPAAAVAQIKNSVAIVRPQMSSAEKQTYSSIASYFRGKGLGQLADYFATMTKGGGFGSGFVVEREDGQRFVITNRHVVVMAEKATLTFIPDEGDEIELKDCPVVYKDDDLDFAAVALPEGKGADIPALTIADKLPPEGADVWTAGYPGLGGKPAWQLAKGNISNRRFVDDELGLKEAAVYIQHSAPIDPGNSGGPLLVGNPAELDSLRVIGINTLQAFERQNTNFAVTLELMKKGLNKIGKVEKSASDDAKDLVTERAEGFIEALNDSESSRFMGSRYMGYGFVAREGWDVFVGTVTKMKTKDRDYWIDAVIGPTIIETLRQYLFVAFRDSLIKKGGGLELKKVESFTNGGATYWRTSLVYENGTVNVEWGFESGSWRVVGANYPTLKMTSVTRDKSSLADDEDAEDQPARSSRRAAASDDEKSSTTPSAVPSGFQIIAGYTSLPMVTGWEPGVDATLGIQIGIGPVVGLSFKGGVFSSSGLVTGSTQSSKLLIGLGADVRLGGFIGLGKGGIFPYAVGGVAVGMNTLYSSSGTGTSGLFSMFGLNLSAGLGLQIQLARQFTLGVEALTLWDTDTTTWRLSGIPVRATLIF